MLDLSSGASSSSGIQIGLGLTMQTEKSKAKAVGWEFPSPYREAPGDPQLRQGGWGIIVVREQCQR